MQKGACHRIWLLYLQGRLSPVQLLALCKLSMEKEKERDQQSSSLGLRQA
ncbi:MAG: hypothetical protein ACFB14_13485 [Leptolyngbyaceae cyanobacterium]